MAKGKRRAFTKEFKAQTVRLVRDSGKSIGVIARELDLGESVLSYRQKLWMSERGDVPFWGVVSSNPENPGATRGERYATCAGAYHREDGGVGAVAGRNAG